MKMKYLWYAAAAILVFKIYKDQEAKNMIAKLVPYSDQLVSRIPGYQKVGGLPVVGG
jgi:hypothetical protein